jgi:uncharacterized membrane protein
MNAVKLINITGSVLIITTIFFLLLPCFNIFAQEKDGLTLSYTDVGYYNDIKPDQTVSVYIKAANYSDNNTENIQFLFNAPNEWIIKFDPQSIETLNSNSYQVIEMSITAPHDLKEGNYSITVIADSDIGRRVIGVYLYARENSASWVWAGTVLGIAALIAFIIVFRIFSRN